MDGRVGRAGREGDPLSQAEEDRLRECWGISGSE